MHFAQEKNYVSLIYPNVLYFFKINDTPADGQAEAAVKLGKGFRALLQPQHHFCLPMGRQKQQQGWGKLQSPSLQLQQPNGFEALALPATFLAMVNVSVASMASGWGLPHSQQEILGNMRSKATTTIAGNRLMRPLIANFHSGSRKETLIEYLM